MGNAFREQDALNRTQFMKTGSVFAQMEHLIAPMDVWSANKMSKYLIRTKDNAWKLFRHSNAMIWIPVQIKIKQNAYAMISMRKIVKESAFKFVKKTKSWLVVSANVITNQSGIPKEFACRVQRVYSNSLFWKFARAARNTANSAVNQLIASNAKKISCSAILL
jgi:hypothetical protein